MTIQGMDSSHWQGKFTSETIQKILSQNIRFAYVKFSQGAYVQDDEAFNNARVLQQGGIKVGAYHFTNNDNAAVQFQNFVTQMEDSELDFDLPPSQDCEAFTAINNREYTLSEVRHALLAPQMYGLMRIAPNKFNLLRLSTKNDTVFRMAVRSLYGLSYPSQAVVDSIGGTSDTKGLTAWMRTKSKLVPFDYPVIYTNASSGNKIFTSTKMNRYLLWVANWRTPIPNLPAVWQGKPYFVWQYDVVNGIPYGIQGQLDVDSWGDAKPFPGGTPPPPPPPDPDDEIKTIQVRIKFESGKEVVVDFDEGDITNA